MDNAFWNNAGVLGQALFGYATFFLRYLVFAGGAWLFFYVLFRRKVLFKRIQEEFPPRSKIRTEILYSLLTFVIFACVGVILAWFRRHGYTQLYFHLSDYPLWWFFLSIPLMLLLHDAWFYWTHRFMHLKKIFPLFHKVHHLSNNPSPWASFSFHPLEAVVEAGILPLIAFTLPAHPLAILIFLLMMTVMNVIGHLGYEIFPSGFTKNSITKWSNTSTHHNMHHRLVKCNYGLYFNFWDRIMGTNHEKYHEQFEEVAGRKRKDDLSSGRSSS
ncbi:MAG TPA: sterol desaturase family protein [Bacteroidia bacterium]|nr:sterol desaturase family protein [Bacteroidia bacterium]